MLNIQIVSVGNKPRPAVNDLITTYESRLPKSIRVNWNFIKHGSGDVKNSMQNEAEKILKAIPANSYVILLDESGIQMTSEQFSKQLFERKQDLCFIIGGAYGVAENVFTSANMILSLSEMVMPHQIVRAVLIEQIYRAHTIASGHPYHHS